MKDIKTLLQRYYDGETTLEEEAYLQQYLAAQPDAADPGTVQLMTDIKGIKATVQQPVKRLPLAYRLWTISGVAAAVAVLIWTSGPKPLTPLPVRTATLSSSLLADPELEGEIKDQTVALEQARKALTYVSIQLNKGTQGIRHLDQLEQSVDKIKNESL